MMYSVTLIVVMTRYIKNIDILFSILTYRIILSEKLLIFFLCRNISNIALYRNISKILRYIAFKNIVLFAIFSTFLRYLLQIFHYSALLKKRLQVRCCRNLLKS